TAHVFLWNSVSDAVAPSGVNAAVQIRLRPGDGQLGAAATTPNFSVDNTGKTKGAGLGGVYPIRVNSTSRSDWATSVASDGPSIYTIGFEDFDFEATSGADTTWRLEKRTLLTGALVPGFGSGGVVTANPGAGLDLPFKVLCDGANLFVLAAQET